MSAKEFILSGRELGSRRVANDWVRRLGVAVCLSYGFMFLICYACKPFCSQLYFDWIWLVALVGGMSVFGIAFVG